MYTNEYKRNLGFIYSQMIIFTMLVGAQQNRKSFSNIDNSNTEINHHKINNKSKCVSYRLPIDTIMNLNKRSKQLQISPNFLVKQTLDKYLTWDVFASEVGLIPFPKELLPVLMKVAPIDKIMEFSTLMYELIKDWIIFQKGEYTWVGFLEVFSNLMNALDVTFIIKNDLTKNHIIIRHKMGVNLSLFFDNMFTQVLNDFINKNMITPLITNNTYKVTIPTTENLNFNSEQNDNQVV